MYCNHTEHIKCSVSNVTLTGTYSYHSALRVTAQTNASLALDIVEQLVVSMQPTHALYRRPRAAPIVAALTVN